MELSPWMEQAELVRERTPVTYTGAEQQFSSFVQTKLYRLLRGDDNDFILMRRCCGKGGTFAFLMPPRLKENQLRPEVAEEIISAVLRLLDPFSPGGPIAQRVDGDRLTETQVFPTQYPHIIVERTDVFNKTTQRRLYAEWKAVRLQNQRKSTLVNRALDFGVFALELARFAAA